jgi:hypothetical protein
MCQHRRAAKSRFLLVSLLMASLVVVGVVNFVMAKILFASFTSGNWTNATADGAMQR